MSQTRDGVLICVHDICLEATTDAAAVFPNRARGDGRWYAADFDVKEIRLLQARERFDFRNMLYLPDFEQHFCTTFKKGRVLPRKEKDFLTEMCCVTAAMNSSEHDRYYGQFFVCDPVHVVSGTKDS